MKTCMHPAMPNEQTNVFWKNEELCVLFVSYLLLYYVLVVFWLIALLVFDAFLVYFPYERLGNQVRHG